ncbi:zf-DHHC-domain-containing protein [Gigaspora margarita]|uniref:Palmitoyltransferase n=1 Tax=Gigaspora margarita TaxID=4874 RepID=A0A8H4A9I0_GIGMA|nr:zf-DHHC-domain-containing protein [Gigaspora margarita]
MSNQARASRHASGILPSKQFFAPRKPITQNASRRKSNTLSVINTVLEPIAPAVVLEPSSYRQIRHESGSNILSWDLATATSFSRHSDSDSSGTLSTQLQIIPPKKLTQTKPPVNTSPYASIAKSMPRIVYNPAPISHADSKGLKRLYQVWPGRNRFFFGGRIMTSRDFPAFLVAFSALVVPSVLFLAFTCPYLFHNISPAVVFVFAYLFLLALTSMLRTSWSDPGIIPRNLDPSPPTEDLEDPENNAQNNPNSPYYPTRSVPLPKEVNINGQPVRLKYCETCRIYRPPRCSHCRQCDNCVENEDHHCIWLNNCIGKRNYRTFFTFIATATILCVYVSGFCLVHIFLLMKEQDLNFISAITIAPVSFVLAVLSFFLMWSVGGLTMYHMYLISKNLTTHEQIRIPIPRRNDTRNPFDYRNISRNCMWVLCRPLTKSSVSRRAYVEEEFLNLGQGEGVLNEQRVSQQTTINNTEQNTVQNTEQNTESNTELNIKLNINNTEPKITETHEQE